MTLNSLFSILKGGPKSGNFGHSGRLGKRGGSGPGLATAALGEFAISPILRDLLSGKATYEGDAHPIFVQLTKELGFTAKPQMVNNLDDHIAEGDLELHRGVSARTKEQASEYVKDFKQGELLIGEGVYGAGTYTALDFNEAKKYTGLSGTSGLIRMGLDKSAKVIDVREVQAKLESLYKESDRKADQMVQDAFDHHKAGDLTGATRLLEQSGELRLGGNNLYKAMGADYSIAAAAMGYDAMSVVGKDYMIILNRSKVKVES